MSVPAMTVADILLDCLCKELATRINPPKLCELRIGTDVTQDVTPDDLCCEGLGYVRIGDMFPASESFPEQDTTATNCLGAAWAVEYELGVLRCGDIEGAEAWRCAAEQQMSDREAMIRAICCMKDQFMRDGLVYGIMPTNGSPIEIQGNCAGSVQSVLVQIPGPCCV